MSASAVSAAHLLCSRREREIRELAETDQTIAAALELVDNNGQPYVDPLESLVLLQAGEIATLRGQLTEAIVRPPVLAALPDRTDDDECIVCGETDCQGHGGGL